MAAVVLGGEGEYDAARADVVCFALKLQELLE